MVNEPNILRRQLNGIWKRMKCGAGVAIAGAFGAAKAFRIGANLFFISLWAYSIFLFYLFRLYLKSPQY